MWKSKKINDIEYFINLQTQQAGLLYKFYMTDFSKLWYVEMSKEQIVHQCQEINEWFEADDETLLSESLNLFDVSRTDTNWSFNSDQLVLDSTYGIFKFSYHVDFQLADFKKFSEIVVSPLLLIIKNLQQQKEYLKTCLKKKDTEIAEYKLNGAVISRRNIETPVFHESLIPEMFNEDSEKLSFSKPIDLIDDQMISSYNEIYSLISLKNEKINALSEKEVESGQKAEETRESIKIPKKNLTDVIVRVESTNDICTSSIPIPDPIRKKPPPRKLKNL